MDFNEVTLDQVERVYSGRPGCGCGCRGKYYVPGATDPNRYEETNPKMVKRVFNMFKRLFDERKGVEDRYEGKLGSRKRMGFSAPGVFYYETDKRYYWLYLKEEK
jgi:hypothetical protein